MKTTLMAGQLHFYVIVNNWCDFLTHWWVLRLSRVYNIRLSDKKNYPKAIPKYYYKKNSFVRFSNLYISFIFLKIQPY